MKTPSRELERSAIHSAPRRPGQSQSNALSSFALLFSLLALGLSGFSLYQVFNSQRPADVAANPASQAKAKPTAPEEPTAALATTLTSKPGSLVQPALEGKAEVTILGLERIQDPDQGTNDVVNVKLRLRRLAENVSAFDFVNVGGAIARQPGGSEVLTYDPVDPVNHSTGPISLEGIRKGASVDAYVWLRVPEGINKVDLYLPDTEPFQAIAIAE